MYFPLGIIGVSLATVTLPEAARYASSFRVDLVKYILVRSLRLAMFFVFPICTLMWVLRFHLVRVIYQHGMFQPSDTMATGATLGWFLIGIIGASSTKIIANIFFSLKDTKSPVIISFISSIINLSVVFTLSKYMGIKGLALAVSVASIGGSILLLLVFHLKFNPIPFSELFEGLFKVFLASVLPALLIIPVLSLFQATDLGLLNCIVLIVIISSLYIPLYLIFARFLNFKVTQKHIK